MSYPTVQYPPAGGNLAEHINAENTDVGAANAAGTINYWDTIANAGTLLSQSITTTKRCCIVVVAVVVSDAAKTFHIKRGGVDKTSETITSAANFTLVSMRGYLLSAIEVLDAGTYQYNLINDSGGNIDQRGCVMKIEAISAS